MTRRLAAFLLRLPSRSAILACNDIFANRLIGLCRSLGLKVPQERAILGVDDDHLLLLSAPLPFSSIDPASREIGRLAAMRLQGLLEGHPDDGATLRVAPGPVVARASTDDLGHGDEVLNRAMRFIR